MRIKARGLFRRHQNDELGRRDPRFLKRGRTPAHLGNHPERAHPKGCDCSLCEEKQWR